MTLSPRTIRDGRAHRPGRPRVHVDVEEARRLRAAGHSFRDIAVRLGVGKTTVIRSLALPQDVNAVSDGPKPVQNTATSEVDDCPTCGRPRGAGSEVAR